MDGLIQAAVNLICDVPYVTRQVQHNIGVERTGSALFRIIC